MERFKILVLGFLIFLFGNSLYSQTIPPKPEPAIYVNDFAGIFNSNQKQELEQLLISNYDSTSTQIIVVTLKSLEGMDASQYAIELGEKWGVGQAEKDNGVVFLISPNDRKMFIATGRGTEEKLTDVFLTRIRKNYIGPEFAKGDYYSGVRMGILQMMNRLSGTFQADPKTANENIELTTKDIVIMLIIFFVFLWFISKIAKAANYGETYSSKGYRGGLGGGFWGAGGLGGGSWGSGGDSWGSSGGSFGGGSFGGGGSGGDW